MNTLQEMASTEIHADGLAAVVRRGLEVANDTLFVINPETTAIEAFVSEFASHSTSPAVRLFVEEQTLKQVLDEFYVASRLADLTTHDDVSVRPLREVPRTSLLLTDETLITIVESRDSVAGLTTDRAEFISSTYDHYRRRWKRADSFSLRTPALSEVRETMAAEIGESAVDDFDTVLATLETTRGRDSLDEVVITLLVAANNRALLYDISRWGESISLASKATFSRVKNDLEEAGLLDTEKVPIEVGRPRLRLVLGSHELRNAEIEAVVERAQRTLTRA